MPGAGGGHDLPDLAGPAALPGLHQRLALQLQPQLRLRPLPQDGRPRPQAERRDDVRVQLRPARDIRLRRRGQHRAPDRRLGHARVGAVPHGLPRPHDDLDQRRRAGHCAQREPDPDARLGADCRAAERARPPRRRPHRRDVLLPQARLDPRRRRQARVPLARPAARLRPLRVQGRHRLPPHEGARHDPRRRRGRPRPDPADHRRRSAGLGIDLKAFEDDYYDYEHQVDLEGFDVRRLYQSLDDQKRDLASIVGAQQGDIRDLYSKVTLELRGLLESKIETLKRDTAGVIRDAASSISLPPSLLSQALASLPAHAVLPAQGVTAPAGTTEQAPEPVEEEEEEEEDTEEDIADLPAPLDALSIPVASDGVSDSVQPLSARLGGAARESASLLPLSRMGSTPPAAPALPAKLPAFDAPTPGSPARAHPHHPGTLSPLRRHRGPHRRRRAGPSRHARTSPAADRLPALETPLPATPKSGRSSSKPSKATVPDLATAASLLATITRPPPPRHRSRNRSASAPDRRDRACGAGPGRAARGDRGGRRGGEGAHRTRRAGPHGRRA